MKEEELLNRIKESASDLKVPDSLSPGNITGMLEKGRRRRQSRKKYYYVQTAAALLVLSLCVYAYTVIFPGEMAGVPENGAAEIAEVRPSQEDHEGSTPDSVTGQNRTEDAVPLEKGEQELTHKDAGDSYVVAKSYSQVLETVNNSLEAVYTEQGISAGSPESASDGTGNQNIPVAESPRAETADEISQDKQLTDSSLPYSSTNVQTDGVDESDIVITDGSYLYVRNSQGVEIVDLREGSLKKAGYLTLTDDRMDSEVLEMYVDGDRLYLIIQDYNTLLHKDGGSPEAGTGFKRRAGMPESDVQGNVGEANDGAIYLGSCGIDDYLMNTDAQVNVFTYDISDRRKPVLIDTMTQDGHYKTSRKLGDILYLFTEKRVNIPVGLSDKEKERGDRFIPLVNGEMLAEDCIYLPESGSTGLIVSSIDVNKPGEIVDNIMIMHDTVDIYVSQSAMYLYQTKYMTGQSLTEIAKFSLDHGRIDAVNAESVHGIVTDTFAVNEYQGQLRILTNQSDASGRRSNSLYLFDSELKLTGTLENIAEEESIYAARFMGTMAYFVTYRNTDPLFAADLSDSRNPKLLGELKITGFSEYLHFWGENKLLGIGYETDQNSGEYKGIKLVMFDISDPADLKVLGSIVVKGGCYSPALDLGEYKGIMADPGENLIGFTTVSRGNNVESSDYCLFSWEDNGFQMLLEESVTESLISSECRGIYVGNLFLVVTPEEVRSYDRQNGYKHIETLEW